MVTGEEGMQKRKWNVTGETEKKRGNEKGNENGKGKEGQGKSKRK